MPVDPHVRQLLASGCIRSRSKDWIAPCVSLWGDIDAVMFAPAWHHRPAPDIELNPAGEPLLPNWGRTGLLGPVDLPPDPPDEL
jgi:hypothetical protein